MSIAQSDSINELAAALAKAQSEIEGAKKDSANPFFKSKYADLESVWTACRVPLTKNGLSVVQLVSSEGDDGKVTVTTQLLHSSGQWIRGSLTGKPVKADPQGTGSCITYYRRYGLAAIVGVFQADDDGNAASNRKKLESVPIENPEPDAVESSAGISIPMELSDPADRVSAWKQVLEGVDDSELLAEAAASISMEDEPTRKALQDAYRAANKRIKAKGKA